MSANTGSALPISWDDIAPHLALATQHLKGISYAPKKKVENLKGAAPEKSRGWSDSSADEAQKSESVAIFTIAKDVNKKDDLLDELINSSLSIVRTGLQVAMFVAAKYAEASNFTTLKERKDSSKGRMNPTDEAEWAAKQETQAAITVFVLASYVSWRFAQKDEKKANAEVDFAGLPEPIAVGNQIRSIGCVLYHWGSYLKTVQTPAQFNKLTQLYFAEVVKHLQGRAQGFKYLEPFVNVIYKLDATDFLVRGFQTPTKGTSVKVVKRIVARQIVGNSDMKRKLKYISQLPLAYDRQRKMNVYKELGAYLGLGVLQGNAGTGKSMGLGHAATMISDNCEATELPFKRITIPNAIVQSLQGDSARVYEEWWRSCYDPEFICLAEVDDSEAVYLDRRSHSSSEGSKLVIMSHLRLSEGSTAEDFGQCIQIHATNNADMIDPPVFSRYQYRILVPGAETEHDFSDQMKLWGDDFNEKTKVKGSADIIKLEFPGDYKFLSDQDVTSKDERDRKVEAFIKFKNKDLQQLWE